MHKMDNKDELRFKYNSLRENPVDTLVAKNAPVELVLSTKLAHATTFEEFEKALKTGDLPPMELTEEEMALAKGGALPYSWFWRDQA